MNPKNHRNQHRWTALCIGLCGLAAGLSLGATRLGGDARLEALRQQAVGRLFVLSKDGIQTGDSEEAIAILTYLVLTEDSGTIRDGDAGGPVASTAATDPGGNNTGDGTIPQVRGRDHRTLSEVWTVACINADTPGQERWSVVGSVSGAQRNAVSNRTYATDLRQVAFVLQSGTVPFAVGDDFTFTTTAATGAWAQSRLHRVLGRAKLRGILAGS